MRRGPGVLTLRSILLFFVCAAGPPDALALPPANDECAQAAVVASLPFTDTIDTSSATTSPDDPIQSCVSSQNSNSVWYSFTSPADTTIQASTAGSTYDTVLSAYAGACGALDGTDIACNDDLFSNSFVSLQSEITFPVVAGQTVLIEVTDFGSAGGGSLILSLQTTAAAVPGPGVANDECLSAALIPRTPFRHEVDTRLATTDPSDPVVSCNGSDDRSVWYGFTAPADGLLLAATEGSDYDTVLSAHEGICGSLVEVGCDNDGAGLQSILLLPVAADDDVLLEVTDTGTGGGVLSFSADLFPPPTPAPNDACASATPVTGLPFRDSVDTTLATTAPDDPNGTCTLGQDFNSVWYDFTAPSTGTFVASTRGSDYNTVLSAYKGRCGAITRELACNDDRINSSQAGVAFHLKGGNAALLEATSFFPGGGTLLFSMDSVPPPKNDTCADARIIDRERFVDIIDTSAATKSPADPAPSCFSLAPKKPPKTVWYRLPPDSGGFLRATTIGSNYDAVLTAYSGPCGALREDACSDVAIDEEELLLEVDAGEAVRFEIGDPNAFAPTTLNFQVDIFESDCCIPGGARASCDDLDCRTCVCQDLGRSSCCVISWDETCSTFAQARDDLQTPQREGCRDRCRCGLCGDGLLDPDEQCDTGLDGSDTASDRCRLDCTCPRCGDGVLDSTAPVQGCAPTVEECDSTGMDTATCDGADCTLPACGDGYANPAAGEECDDGARNDDMLAGACRTSCLDPYCGDGVVDMGEQCDDGLSNSDDLPDVCRTNCRLPRCGDGVTDTGEQCDGGGCCRVGCLFSSAGVQCRAARDACDQPELCSGSDGRCPDDIRMSAGAECRPASNDCDRREVCTAQGICPPDEFMSEDEPCTDGDPCTPTDTCDGRGSCIAGGTLCGDGDVDTAHAGCVEECDVPADTEDCNGPEALEKQAQCKEAECGDNYTNAAAGEECDLGDTQALDGCDASCLREGCDAPPENPTGDADDDGYENLEECVAGSLATDPDSTPAQFCKEAAGGFTTTVCATNAHCLERELCELDYTFSGRETFFDRLFHRTQREEFLTYQRRGGARCGGTSRCELPTTQRGETEPFTIVVSPFSERSTFEAFRRPAVPGKNDPPCVKPLDASGQVVDPSGDVRKYDVTECFEPLLPGTARKVDLPLADAPRTVFVFKVKGWTSTGKHRKDRDRFVFINK
jgi:hypothetical protein